MGIPEGPLGIPEASVAIPDGSGLVLRALWASSWGGRRPKTRFSENAGDRFPRLPWAWGSFGGLWETVLVLFWQHSGAPKAPLVGPPCPWGHPRSHIGIACRCLAQFSLVSLPGNVWL